MLRRRNPRRPAYDLHLSACVSDFPRKADPTRRRQNRCENLGQPDGGGCSMPPKLAVTSEMSSGKETQMRTLKALMCCASFFVAFFVYTGHAHADDDDIGISGDISSTLTLLADTK